MSPDLQSYLEEKRACIDDRLAAYVADAAVHSRRLSDALHYSLLAPGKRLRPLLVLMAAEAASGKWQEALPAACAVEMVHTYSLVHDDLPAMDDDDLRRGRATCHKQFDEATAILVGDGLLTFAFQVLSEDIRPADLANQCIRELSRAAGPNGMVAGQMEDLQRENQNGGDIQALEAIHRRKTGAMFSAALKIGGLIGLQYGMVRPLQRAALLNAFEEYGNSFGLAFQISDDLLDAVGNANQTGKRVQKDAGKGKLTYAVLLGVEESRKRLQNCCREAEASLAPLGDAGKQLVELVQYLQERES